jgi:hypothetical protein
VIEQTSRCGDAFITAQVFLRLLKLAARHGRTELGAISHTFVQSGTDGTASRRHATVPSWSEEYKFQPDGDERSMCFAETVE